MYSTSIKTVGNVRQELIGVFKILITDQAKQKSPPEKVINYLA